MDLMLEFSYFANLAGGNVKAEKIAIRLREMRAAKSFYGRFQIRQFGGARGNIAGGALPAA